MRSLKISLVMFMVLSDTSFAQSVAPLPEPPAPRVAAPVAKQTPACDLAKLQADCEAYVRKREKQVQIDRDASMSARKRFERLIRVLGEGVPSGLPTLLIPPSAWDKSVNLNAGVSELHRTYFCRPITSCTEDPISSMSSGWTDGEYVLKGTWPEYAAVTMHDMQERFSPRDFVRQAALGLLGNEVKFSVVMAWMADRVPSVLGALFDGWREELTRMLVEGMETAFSTDFAFLAKVHKLNQPFQHRYGVWISECHDEDGKRRQGCDDEEWEKREPKRTEQERAISALWELNAYGIQGSLVRRYLEGGADRITLMLVWGSVIADKLDHAKAGEWAGKTLERLKNAKKLNMAPYYRRTLSEIVARRQKPNK